MVVDAISLMLLEDSQKLVQVDTQVLPTEVSTVRVGMISAFKLVEGLSLGKVKTHNGEVWIEDDYILYRPDTEGVGGFYSGLVSYECYVEDNVPETPVIEFPKGGGVISFSEVEASVDKVFINNPNYVNMRVSWEIASDSGFDNVLATIDNSDELKKVIFEGLEYGNSYYVRARVFASE